MRSFTLRNSNHSQQMRSIQPLEANKKGTIIICHERKPGPKPQDIMKSKKSNYYTRHEIEAFGRMVSGSGDKFVQKDNKSYLREVQIMAQQVVDIVESAVVLQTVSVEQGGRRGPRLNS
eukprot:913549_1